MSLFDDGKKLLDALRGAFLEASPPSLDIKYGPGHPLEGEVEKTMVRTRGANGVESYTPVVVNTGGEEEPGVWAEHQHNHRFTFLPDFCKYVNRPFSAVSPGGRAVFVNEDQAEAVVDGYPELGGPSFSAKLFSGASALMAVDQQPMNHERFALFVDGMKEHLAPESAMLAKLCRVFAYSRTVEAELSPDGNNMLRTKFEGRGQTDAPVTLPQEFYLLMPYFGNVDDHAKLPLFLFRVSLRVVPPKGDEGPRFVMEWVNDDQVKSEAYARLVSDTAVMCGTDVPVYRGVANHAHLRLSDKAML